RCPCFGSLYPPLAALTFAAQSIICAFGLAAAAPRSPYRHLELCGIALNQSAPPVKRWCDFWCYGKINNKGSRQGLCAPGGCFCRC
ncbi:MAG: hypothetical protein SO256_05315, partial [Gemmiger sp.]|uniref:hypothetical protein n=1 Tax=Gemmiger sp. TaxID=2049027 RepID=UPI002A8289F2